MKQIKRHNDFVQVFLGNLDLNISRYLLNIDLNAFFFFSTETFSKTTATWTHIRLYCAC